MVPRDLRKAHAVVDAIVNALGVDVTELESAPEVRKDTTEDALHRLQAQVFILTDALSEIAGVLQYLLDEPAEPKKEPARFPLTLGAPSDRGGWRWPFRLKPRG